MNGIDLKASKLATLAGQNVNIDTDPALTLIDYSKRQQNNFLSRYTLLRNNRISDM